MNATTTPVRFERRPAFAAMLTVLGGLFVVGGAWTLVSSETALDRVFALGPLYRAGVVVGVLLVAFGGLGLAVPRTHRAAGAVVLALATLSIPLAFGGFVAGFVLSVMGGTFTFLGPTSARSGLRPTPVRGFGRR